MNMTKRLFDIIVALAIVILLLPLIAFVSLLILLRDGRPVFYVSERMKAPGQGFVLLKFRTMRSDKKDMGATGAHKNNRITKTGLVLRRSRIDEIPQLWNILVGDMSFVGPRPPLRRYVEKFPELYSRVLHNRPGVTGLASVYFHRHEEWLLRNATSTEETEEIYCRSCVPRKARLDLIYQENQSLCMDIMLMLKTVIKRLR
jgi:lipopolysaccharide/colanic/teichoic acid biosynthesis glycosyltransferase